MAKTVGELLVELKVDGIQGVEQLKSSLRNLNKATGPTDKALEEIGRELKNLSRAGQQSRQQILGQIDAFKGLRDQATLGGKAFKSFSKDVENYKASLKAVDAQIEATGKKIKTIRQLETQFTAKTPAGVASNVEGRRRNLERQVPLTSAYAAQLGAITALEQGSQRALARQDVVANAQRLAKVTFSRGGSVSGGPGAFADALTEGLGPLPQTTAALSLRLTELRQDFQHLAVGSKPYIDSLRQINALEAKVADPFGTAGRKEQIRGRLGQQQRFGMFEPRDPVQSAIARRERKRSRRYGGFTGGGLANQPVEASGLFRQIAGISGAGRDAGIEMMGKSYDQVANSIRDATLASNGSINSLQAQRASWSQLRAGLSPASKDYQEVGREIEKVDRQLEKINRRRRRPTVGGAAQVLGGIAAGGVFGGPEGALGGAVGGAVGGIAGVAAGAAIGAQVKMVREALGATAEYAAELKKLEIALEGVTRVTDEFGNVDVVSSLGNYQAGLNAARKVTQEFNVPLSVSTKGITRLAAAVIGAGGHIGDAEIVFRNITTAIKGTGGSAQDVESAITAMVQTFSKGRVSAEELSGQLGERLPGAVTKFAEANNMTLPELQKAFKAGTVGLNELMTFVVSLGPEYEETARQIADSSADSGARTAVAFEQVRREIGEALQPIGAQLQEAFGRFAIETLPLLKGASTAAAAGINGLLNVTAALIKNFKELLIIAGVAGIAAALANLKAIIFALKVAVFDLKLAFAGLNAVMLANPWVAAAAGLAALAVVIHKAATANDRFNKSVIKGEVTNTEANDRLREMNNKVKDLQKRLETETNGRMLRALKNQLKAAKIAADDLSLAMALASTYTVAGVTYDRMSGRAIDAPMSVTTPTTFEDPTDVDTGTSAKAEIQKMTDIELALHRQMRGAIAEENEILKANLQLALDMTTARQETEDLNKRINMEEAAQAKFQETIKSINKKTEDEELQRLQTKQQLDRDLQNSLNNRKLELGLITQEEFNQLEIARERQRLEELRDPDKGGITDTQIEEQMDMFKKVLNQTPLDRFIKSGKDSLKDLHTVAVNISQGIGNAVGNAMTSGIMGLIEGTKTAKEVFADFLKSVGQILAQEGAKMIATYIAIGIAKAFAGLLGGGSDKAINPTSLTAIESYSGAASSFDAGSFATAFPLRANGGPVEAGRPYMVGERGPEMFIPGSNGGIMRNEDMRRMMGNSPAGAGAPQMNFTFETTNIGGTEFVSREQLEQAMVVTRRQATNDGAKRGMSMTLDKMQNSPRTRSRVGIS